MLTAKKKRTLFAKFITDQISNVFHECLCLLFPLFLPVSRMITCRSEYSQIRVLGMIRLLSPQPGLINARCALFYLHNSTDTTRRQKSFPVARSHCLLSNSFTYTLHVVQIKTRSKIVLPRWTSGSTDKHRQSNE